MRIHSVTAHAFGPLADATLQLADGMTVVVGDNESGKSSWHAAIYAALCGRRRGQGAGTVADREFRARHHPWSGDEWLVSAILTLDDDRRIEMRQDLAGKVKCSATDLSIGHDVSSEIMFEGSPDASRWLGLDRSSFVTTACVNQAHLLDVRSGANGLQAYLQRAATTATADATAAGAIALIEEYQRKHVGVDRANAVKPLRLAIKAEQSAADALGVATADHAEYLSRIDKAELAGVAEATARREVQECEAIVATGEADRTAAAFARAEALAEECGGIEPRSDESHDDLDQQVLAALTAYDARPAEPDPVVPTAADLDAQIAALPAMPDGDTVADPSVVRAVDEVRRAVMAVDAHDANRPTPAAPTPSGADERELLDLAHTLETPPAPVPAGVRERVASARVAAQPGRGGRRTALLVAAGLVAVVALVLFAFGQPSVGGVAAVVAVALGVSGALRRDGQVPPAAITELAHAESSLQSAEAEAQRRVQSHADATRRCAELGLDADPTILRALAVAVANADAIERGQKEWAARAAALVATRDHAAAQLQDALARRGVEFDGGITAAALLVAADGYVRDCADRAAVAAQARRAVGLSAQRDLAVQAEARADRDRHARTAATAALIDAVAACGHQAEDEDAAYAWLSARQASRRDERAQLNDRSRRWTELQTLLAGRTLDQLAADATKARQRADMLAVDSVSADLTPDEAERRLPQLREELRAAQISATRAHAEASEFAAHISSVAEAEERLAETARELDRVRGLERTLRLTQQFLEAAEAEVHRSIAPLLNQSLTEHLPAITSGRYTDAVVDPDDLTVKVCGASRNWHPAEQLSFGTTEQIYLLLRAALADHLTREHDTCPLILDDVTVHADATRKVEILHLLHALSKDRQVIVFTQERQVADWARATLTSERDAVLELNPVAVA